MLSVTCRGAPQFGLGIPQRFGARVVSAEAGAPPEAQVPPHRGTSHWGHQVGHLETARALITQKLRIALLGYEDAAAEDGSDDLHGHRDALPFALFGLF